MCNEFSGVCAQAGSSKRALEQEHRRSEDADAQRQLLLRLRHDGSLLAHHALLPLDEITARSAVRSP
jgi:hypothetical protein